MTGMVILTLRGDPIARSEPEIVRFGKRMGMKDSAATAKGKAAWLAVWIDAGRPRIDPFDGPIQAYLEIVMERPQGHFGSGRNSLVLKPGARRMPTVKPDCSNVLKLVEDALNTRAFKDDSQVVGGTFAKRYCVDGETPYTRVQFNAIPDPDALFPPTTQEAITT